MRLFEYEGLSLFRERGIRTPDFEVAADTEGVVGSAGRIGYPVFLKAQVLFSSREKAGGVVLVHSADEARSVSERMFGQGIGGERVPMVLVSSRVEVWSELYLSATMDRSAAKPVLLSSSLGGVDIEEAALRNPESMVKEHVDPVEGLHPDQGGRICEKLSLPVETRPEFIRTCSALWSLMSELDADLVEVNPLALSLDLELIALDSKVILNDDALYRHPEFAKLSERRRTPSTELEAMAGERGVTLVDLGGDIGIIGNGAGLTMATMDLVKQSGGEPATFLDIGGGASSEAFEKCLSLLLSYPRIRVVFVNVFGGITRCDEIATGIARALGIGRPEKPIIARLVGTNEREAAGILREIRGAEVEAFGSAEAAALRAVQLSRGT